MDILQQLKEANQQRIKSFGHDKIDDWSLSEWGCAIAGETGELCNVIKKIHRGDFSLKDANEKNLLSHEAADIVIYLDLLCQRAGLDLREAIVDKYNKKSKEIGANIFLNL